ncbi:MAG TPA: hypothetical protein VJ764_00400, partial [Steroidobacteraceae bacterium]|nr:hypothetical protein [Steroidobacteraceae bacterium]
MRIEQCAHALRSQFLLYLLSCFAALLLFLLVPTAKAGPLVIEETARLTSPDPSFTFGSPVAVGGNSIIVGGSRPALNPEFPGQFELAAFLFERNSSGAWIFVRKLTEFLSRNEEGGEVNYDFDIAMNSLVAGVMFGELRVFERTAAGWVSAPALAG